MTRTKKRLLPGFPVIPVQLIPASLVLTAAGNSNLHPISYPITAFLSIASELFLILTIALACSFYGIQRVSKPVSALTPLQGLMIRNLKQWLYRLPADGRW
jgi:hypothetical protein